MTEVTKSDGGEFTYTGSIYVYQAPVRLWHWINALCILVLTVSGYLIGVAPPTLPGEASDYYTFGYIRFAHFSCGYIFTVAFLVRVYWAFVGNEFSRRMFYLPIWSRRWWGDFFYLLRWYVFLERAPLRTRGCNPVAQTALFVMITLPTFFIILTGFALYGEGLGIDGWVHMLMPWLFDLFPNTLDLHTWHRFSMWIMIVFAILHIYAAIRDDIVSGQSVMSTMFSGERMFKDTDHS